MAPPRGRIINMMIGYAVGAFVVTSLRLAIRKVRNWGKDDLLAVLATVGLMAQAALMALKQANNPLAVGTPERNANVYYVNNFLFYTQDWFARLSILFSILRICPTQRMAIFLKVTAVGFFLVWVTLLGILFGHCKKDEYEWSRKPTLAICQLPKSIIYLQFAAGLLSDVILIGVPLRILTHLPGLKGLAFRLRVLFCSTILLTIATAAQTAVTLSGAGKAGTNGLTAATTETFVAILVCNTTALASAWVALFGKEEDRRPLRGEVSTVTQVGISKDGNSSPSSSKIGITETSEKHIVSFSERWKKMDIDAEADREIQTTASKV